MIQTEKMILESIRLKNFRTFKNAVMKDIPRFCILVGANGSGKSTLFAVFEFLKEALKGNVNTALAKIGGSRGFEEVRSRNTSGPIEIEIKFRQTSSDPLVTYSLQIDKEKGRAYVKREVLKYRRAKRGQPWKFLDFSNGKGTAITNEIDLKDLGKSEKREEQSLKSNDILAVKGLAQFEKFPVVQAFGTMIENWEISDFHIDRARQNQEAGFAEHLSREGENLSLVLQFLRENHPEIFDRILTKLASRIPGMTKVEAKTTEEGRVLLKFQDKSFEDPFLARYVSDGTIKMLTYLVLLNDPAPHPLLCIEEPENQLYVSLLEELAEEFRAYAHRGSQVMVSTHSPDFLNAAELDEVFMLVKKDGYTEIKRARDDEQIARYMAGGDKMGYLWKEGLFQEVNP